MGTKIIKLGSLGDHFDSILPPLGVLWDLLGAIWPRNLILRGFRGKVSPHLESHLASKISKSRAKTKTQCPESGAEKRVLLEVARIGPMCDPYSKYNMFGEVKECPFGWLLGWFWLPFGVTLGHFLQKVFIRGPKKTHQTKSPKIDEKREREESG